ncbi:uncharacterized protein [Apostichopus japonicus]|uniref:uncharacterized protein n=1 Tax=Stichopus japonicus TaxID=307972 RepID=UPI003AB6967A
MACLCSTAIFNKECSDRKSSTAVRILFFFTVLSHILDQSESNVLLCNPQQYVHIHQQGTIYCSVSKPIYGFYWYFEDNPQSIVTMLEDSQAGPRSKTLRIARNGSLIFSNVSLSDEGQFRVDAILDAGGDVSAYIDLVVIVPTTQMYPKIDGCQSDDCRLFRNGELNLTCTMIGRPAVNLTWYNEIAEAAVTDATEQSYKDPSSDMFVSSSTISVKIDIENVHNLTCFPRGLSVPERTKNASVLLMGPTNLDNVYRTKYLNINEDTNYNELLQNRCDREAMFIQRAEPSGETIKMADRYDDHGPLVLTSMCRSNHTYTRTSIKLLRYKTPDDSSASFVEQCQSKNNCIIAADDGNATLTCVVNNTRPAAEISWKGGNQHVSIIETSASASCIFDVCNSSVTIRVKVTSYHGQTEYPHNLMCLVTLPGSGFSDVSSVTLQLKGTDNVNPSSDNVNRSTESCTSPAPSESPSTTPNKVNGECVCHWIIISLLIIIIVILIVVIAYILRSQACKRKDGGNKIVETESEEGKEMIAKKTQETEFADNNE